MKPKDAVYTQGPISRTMLKTAFAMLAGTLAMSGYNIADTYFVGKLGKTPLAAMGFTFPVIMLICCLFHGLGLGVMATAAQAIGSKKQEKAADLVTSGTFLVVVFSIVLAAAGMASSDFLFAKLGAEGKTLEQVSGYMDIWYFGCVTSALTMFCNDILISSGDSRYASTLMVAGLLINVVLDPLFIFGWAFFPAMGIRGAALATIISQFIVTFCGLYALAKRKHLLRFKHLNGATLQKCWGMIIRYAVPSVIGMLMMPIGSVIITRITAHFGDAAVAATAAAGRIEMLAFIFPMALGISLMPMVGQNFGAHLYSRIRACLKFSMRFAFFFLLAMALIFAALAGILPNFFVDDPEVRSMMRLCLLIVPWGFGMIEIHRYSGFFFTGCGRPAVSAWLNALRILGLMIPLSFLALRLNSLAALFAARLVADVTAGTVGYVLAKRMTDRLPEDGMDQSGVPVGKKARKKHPLLHWFKSFASAQSEIDSKSDTQ